MIFCILSAKDALGRIPKINEDLFDIQKKYFDKGDRFWIAVDDSSRVIGTIGVQTVSRNDIWLKRLFVKPMLKRKGIGSALFAVAEEFTSSKGITVIHTRFPDDFYEAAQFYPSKGFIDNGRSDGLRHMIKILSKL